jgi:hypothetical protein
MAKEICKTIIYVTHNREPEPLASVVREHLSKGGLPIISVSHRPLDFGLNIALGNIGLSHQNIYRQMLIGARNAKTKYVMWAEADCLYPPSHLDYIPRDDDSIFFNDNIWRFIPQREIFAKDPTFSICTIQATKKYLVCCLDEILKKRPGFSDVIETGKNKLHHRSIKTFNTANYETKEPVLNVIHRNGMHRQHKPAGLQKWSVDYWPDAKTLRKKVGR